MISGSLTGALFANAFVLNARFRDREALIATAMGLLVAIPATIGYNTFHGSLGVLETRLVNFAGMFLNRVQRELNAHRAVSRSGQAE